MNFSHSKSTQRTIQQETEHSRGHPPPPSLSCAPRPVLPLRHANTTILTSHTTRSPSQRSNFTAMALPQACSRGSAFPLDVVPKGHLCCLSVLLLMDPWIVSVLFFFPEYRNIHVLLVNLFVSGLSCDTWGLHCVTGILAVRRLSCPEACGIFPDRGSNPHPLQWQVDSTAPPGKSL